MEQALAFVLGVGIAAFVWAVVVIVRTVSKVKKHEDSINNIISHTDNLYLEIIRKIEAESERTTRLVGDVYSHVDSRVDKLDAKFCRDGRALTEKSKEFLKG